ncbi:hypothetical protein L2E82_22204 [Cichorium intybus]|uniref:Uncharacterized protein n=1 Tax=Cichorium intybus TaxID=13427 RepID=A0ACB9DXV0_CICIN|nr:hypothetical protein L2E82_22204 [Cichorium intybus]
MLRRVVLPLDYRKERRQLGAEEPIRYRLSLSASDLRGRDVLSKSDPMAVVYAKGKDGSLQELGRTEVVLNSLNPKWITKVKIVANKNSVRMLDLVNIAETAESTRKILGQLTVHAEEELVSKTKAELDPFLLISKYTETGTTVPICRTEDSPLVIECFNFNTNGKHDLLGMALQFVWMSDVDEAVKLPDGYEVVAMNEQGVLAAVDNLNKRI